MGKRSTSHQFNAGDAVLADFGGAQIPGVVSSVEGDRILVRLSQPWVDGTGQPADTAALSADKLSAYVDAAPELTG